MENKRIFVLSQNVINSDNENGTVHITADNANITTSVSFPYLALIEIPRDRYCKNWTFEVNQVKLETKSIQNLSGFPFIYLDSFLKYQKDYNTVKEYKLISSILHKNIDKWFCNTDNMSDMKISLILISTNFEFNHFSSYHINKMRTSGFNTNDYVQIFKTFLFTIRPEGRPNPKPLFEFANSFISFLLTAQQYISFPGSKSEKTCIKYNFFVSGIQYILDYLKKDNEWGPYSVISFAVKHMEMFKEQKEIVEILPFEMYNDVELNSEFFFDPRNIENVISCLAVYGIGCLPWCYNSNFHNRFCEIAKEYQNKKIDGENLNKIIHDRIINSHGFESNDYLCFMKFIEKMTPRTEISKIFSKIATEAKNCPQTFIQFVMSEGISTQTTDNSEYNYDLNNVGDDPKKVTNPIKPVNLYIFEKKSCPPLNSIVRGQSRDPNDSSWLFPSQNNWKGDYNVKQVLVHEKDEIGKFVEEYEFPSNFDFKNGPTIQVPTSAERAKQTYPNIEKPNQQKLSYNNPHKMEIKLPEKKSINIEITKSINIEIEKKRVSPIYLAGQIPDF